MVREAGQLNAADAKRLAAYLEDPLPTTALVLVGGGGTVPQALTKAVGAVGRGGGHRGRDTAGPGPSGWPTT